MSLIKSPPDHFTVLYFAAASSYTKRKHDFFKAPLPISRLFELLEQRHIGITENVLCSSAITINLNYIDTAEEVAKGEHGAVIEAGDEVGIIPPVSSG